MDRELQRQIRRMTDEGLQGFDFNNEMKGHVRDRVASETIKKEYRRRWYAPLISFIIILLFVFVFAVVKGEQWGFLGSEKLSGYFTNKSNFDVEIRYSPGPVISTFTDSITNGEEEIPLSFTKTEMNEMYTKVEGMKLKEDDSLSGSEGCYSLLNRTYTMTIRMNKELYEYDYSDCGTNADKREFEELRELIMTILKQKPAYEDILKQEIMM